MIESSASIPYPWQQPYWQSFIKQYEQQRLPHATLLSGQKGVGKWHYAQTMADFLLCSSPRSGLACGECRSCELNRVKTHPDKSLVVPEDTGKQIKIDQVRELSTRISSTAQQGGRKVIIIGPVEQLNMNAANALLKNLEEPVSDTFFILFSHVSSGVIATIRSRCQLSAMTAPDRSVSINWLQDLGFSDNVPAMLEMAAGAPLIARELLENNELVDKLERFFDGLQSAQASNLALPDMTLIKNWLDIELHDLLEWWIQLICNSISSCHLPNDEVDSDNSTQGDFVTVMSNVKHFIRLCNLQWRFRFMDKLLLAKKQQLQGANPNKQLLLEELLLDWYAILKTARLAS